MTEAAIFKNHQLAKSKKNYHLKKRWTNFDEIWHADASWPSAICIPSAKIKFQDFKNPRWRTANILKIKH